MLGRVELGQAHSRQVEEVSCDSRTRRLCPSGIVPNVRMKLHERETGLGGTREV
jgi:hypothetical protein